MGKLGIPTVLVNCAATVTAGEKLIDTPVEAIQKEIGTNILGNFYTIKEFLPDMQRLERGHIITVSSALGFCGPARLSKRPPSQVYLGC
jgi:NAD(P)-dependent dehydrogenase (short-subunit alcohol dehydrogenase family)